MGPVEFADGGRSQHVFSGLAKQSGLSIRDCVLAAENGMLGRVVLVAELRKRRTRGSSPTYRGRRTLSGAQALSRLQLMRATWDDG